MSDALRTLYPQIITVDGDTAYDVNGNVVQYDLEAVKAKELEFKEAAVAAKTSALSKLSALGLTDAEIKALTGN